MKKQQPSKAPCSKCGKLCAAQGMATHMKWHTKHDSNGHKENLIMNEETILIRVDKKELERIILAKLTR